MAGVVRQPINVASLSAFIEKNVPSIKLPISLTQVLSRALLEEHCLTSALVWLWSIKSYLPAQRSRWKELRFTKEATGKAAL